MTLPLPLPTLLTERLTLRAPRAEDWEAYAAFAGSPRAAGIGGPFARWQAWRRFAGIWGHFALRGFTRFAVCRRGTEERALGLVGPYHPEEWPEPEIAWTVFEEAEGQGVAFEAARRVRRHLYEDLGWPTAISVCTPGNARSIALAERLGCRPDGSFAHPEWGEMPIWRHPGPAEIEGSAAA